MLVTGFCVAAEMPETDGPLGAASLGRALRLLGKDVVYVTSPANAAVMAAALWGVDRDANARLCLFTASHEDPRACGLAATALLDREGSDAVVAIEVPGRATDGHRYTMRGAVVDAENPPLDEIVLTAYQRGLTTVGIGDGGNEAGMGGLTGIPRALVGDKGREIAAIVPARYPVTAWNANLGGHAVAALLLAAAGRLDAMHTPLQEAVAIETMFAHGAVDGITRTRTIGDAESPPNLDGGTGVDGFSATFHARMLALLVELIATE